MLRQLYIILLALHPARFRYRFAFEMLAIYDEDSAHGGRLPLLADGVRSLVRQWVHPYRPVAAAAVPGGASTPVFHLLDTSPPKRRYFMTGATLSLVIFSALTTSMGRGGRSAGILIGAFHSRPSVLGLYRDSVEPAQPTTEVKVRPAPPESTGTTEFSFGALDRDGNGVLSTAEMANAPAVLRTLDLDKDGSLSPTEAYLMLAVFDQDRNGIISSAEIDNSTAVLHGLDANHDGTLVPEEVVAAVFAAKGH